MNTELFEIESDEKRNRLLKRIYFMAIMFFIFTIITGLFDLLNGYKLYRFYSKYYKDTPLNFRVQSLINVVFLVLYGILLPVQAWFFYLFASKAKTLDLYNQSETFYDSLKWLVRQATIAVILFGINAIWAIIDVLVFYDWT